MAEESIVFSTVLPPASSEDEDYEALHAAVAETPHGRWFLQEYARRHRAVDTQRMLGAIARLECTLSTNESGEIPPQIYAQLLDTTKVIAQARAQIEESAGALASATGGEYRAQMLAALVADLECRISSMLQLAAYAGETSAYEPPEKDTEFDIDRGERADEPPDIPPLAAEPVDSELRTENELFELELDPLRVEPLLAAELHNEEPRLGAAQDQSELHIAADVAATTFLEIPLPYPQTAIAGPAQENVLGEAHPLERPTSQLLSETEQILLLRDQTDRGNLPALAYVFWPAVLSNEVDKLVHEPLSGTRGDQFTGSQSATEQSAAATASEAEPLEGLTGESPLENDTLSSAWMLQVTRPLDEALAARQVSSQEVEGGTALPSKGLGAPPRAAMASAEPEEAGSDSILAIEQELFAPTHEITHAHSVTDPLDRTGHIGAEDVVAGKTGGTSPSENRKTTPASSAASAHPRTFLRPTGGLNRAMPRPPSNDPLAPIKAMTDEERIALFT